MNAAVAPFKNIADGQPMLVDSRGEDIPLTERPGILERMDEKASKKIEISQGTAWLLGAAVIIANLAFNYGGSILSSARDDQTQKEQISAVQATLAEQKAATLAAQNEIRNDVKDLNRKFDDVQKALQEQAVQKAKVEGYTLGQTDSGAAGHKP